MSTTGCMIGACWLAAQLAWGGPAAAATNGPQFRGPTGDGHAQAAGLPLRGPGRQPAGRRFMASPAVVGGALLLRTKTLLYRIEEP